MTGIRYTEGPDGIMYPDLKMWEGTDGMNLGKYGRMAMKYLEENHPFRYTGLVMDGELLPVMAKAEQEAWDRLEILMKQMLKRDPIPNPENTMESYRHKEMIRLMAEEIVLKEIIYQVR